MHNYYLQDLLDEADYYDNYEEYQYDEHYDEHYYDEHYEEDQYVEEAGEENSMEKMKHHKMAAMAGIWEMMKMGKGQDEWANGEMKGLANYGVSNEVDLNVANIAPIVSNNQNFINIQTNVETDVDVSVGGCGSNCGKGKEQEISEREMEMIKDFVGEMQGKDMQKEHAMEEFAAMFQNF